MVPTINTTVLMSGAEYFSDQFAINAYMDGSSPVQLEQAKQEHAAIKAALEMAGVKVVQVLPPSECQDGVYTANWGLCRGNKVVLSSLPNKRQDEEPHAEKVLRKLGFELIKPPGRFSGQGDALPCGNLLLTGSNYRTDPAVHPFLSEQLGYKVISLQTIPKLDTRGYAVINSITNWPDSFFYDIDLALAVLSPRLIAWCPDAFVIESQQKIRSLNLERIEVSIQEATEGFACNLVSTGKTIIMSARAPHLKQSIEAIGLKVITPEITELAKGGGYIRCTSLTLENV